MLPIMLLSLLAVTSPIYAQRDLPSGDIGSEVIPCDCAHFPSMSVGTNGRLIYEQPQPSPESTYTSSNGIEVLDRHTDTTIMRDAAPLIELNKIVLQAQDDHDTALVKHSAGNELFAVTQENQTPALYCSGTNLEKKDIAGVCMDGNFFWYSGSDCGGKCKCDDAGKVSCDIPSDCGPQKDVIDYCIGNQLFNCTCLIDTLKMKKLQSKEVDADGSFVRNAEIKDFHLRSIDDHELKARSDNEQGENDGVPLISPCFWNPAMSCGPYTPESRRTQRPWGHPTTLATVVK